MKNLSAQLVAAVPALIWTTATLAGPTTEEEDLAQVYGSEEMVSIATGTRQPVSKAPAVASVVTAAEIKAMGRHGHRRGAGNGTGAARGPQLSWI